MKKELFATLTILMMLSTGCKQETPSPESKAPEVSKAAAKEKPGETKSKVAKIVFIGQKEACECTRKRVDGSLAALADILDVPSGDWDKYAEYE